MGTGKLWAYGLIISLILSFGLPTVHAKAKRKKRIVKIKLEAPRKPVKRARPKRAKPVIVQDDRIEDTEIEPLKKNQKVSNLGIQKEWSKKNKKRKRYKKRSLASKAMKKKAKKAEKAEDETQLKNNDLDKLLNNMKDNTEVELLTEYEGSL